MFLDISNLIYKFIYIYMAKRIRNEFIYDTFITLVLSFAVLFIIYSLVPIKKIDVYMQ